MSTFFTELKRRRVFRVAAAYAIVGWLLIEIATQVFPVFHMPDWAAQLVVLLIVIGFPIAVVLAWAFDVTPQGIVRTKSEIDTSGSRSDLLSSGNGVPVSNHDKSVAILPFADLSQAHDQDWFCDGLAEEIIDVLSCVRGLRVASRTASFRFRDGSVDPREIGQQLRVGAILEGSVRKAGECVRVTAQLIDAVSGYHLWSETYDRGLADVFAIQSEIARKVSAALRVSLTGDEAARRERYAPRNIQAHEFYLRGRQLAGKISVTDWRKAAAMFRRAIELDPEYAHAHAGLADALAQLLLWRFVRAEDVLPEATRAAHRALELAPDLAEVHVALGHIRSLTGDNDGATRSFERALTLNPELFDAYYYFARHCLAHGEFVRAAELFRVAFSLRPDDSTVLALAVSALDASGNPDAAEATAREALVGLLHQLELDPDNARAHYLLAGVLARLGQREAGKPHVEAALRLNPDDYSTLYNAACYYSLAGDCDRALDLLERACASGGGSRDWIEHDSDLNALRDNPRFRALMARLDDRGHDGTSVST
ncbi:MAG: TPR end-of-group domain-containing protein [Rudaea sp.]